MPSSLLVPLRDRLPLNTCAHRLGGTLDYDSAGRVLLTTGSPGCVHVFPAWDYALRRPSAP